ncbi:hypothetical protein CEXT_8151 [Caerostris extrusa]|uniref:Uncharacterized protein n=1 Tax=Caerostris extrusa TaxID=172846 RepID=A0AAV4XSK3_CAEEX|nr:hypothetical protein CEXT_8151 [Caerostris extrusa]
MERKPKKKPFFFPPPRNRSHRWNPPGEKSYCGDISERESEIMQTHSSAHFFLPPHTYLSIPPSPKVFNSAIQVRYKSQFYSIPTPTPPPPSSSPLNPFVRWKTNFISRQQTPYFVFPGRRFSLYANPKPYLRALHSVHGYCLMQPPSFFRGDVGWRENLKMVLSSLSLLSNECNTNVIPS